MTTRTDSRAQRILDTLLTSPATFDWWQLGYGTGYQHGLDAGRQQVEDEWGAAVVAAYRDIEGWTCLGMRVERITGGRRTTTYTTPALTAEEIHRRAAEPWPLTEPRRWRAAS